MSADWVTERLRRPREQSSALTRRWRAPALAGRYHVAYPTHGGLARSFAPWRVKQRICAWVSCRAHRPAAANAPDQPGRDFEMAANCVHPAAPRPARDASSRPAEIATSVARWRLCQFILSWWCWRVGARSIGNAFIARDRSCRATRWSSTILLRPGCAKSRDTVF